MHLELTSLLLMQGVVFREAGTPRTHRRFLGREDGSYGPIPSRRPAGMLGMPMNRTGIQVRQAHACCCCCCCRCKDHWQGRLTSQATSHCHQLLSMI